MKLDKIKFSRIIGHCVSNGMTAGDWEIEKLDDLIDVDVPVPDIIHPASSDISQLMFLMQQGTKKIEAIKLHRKLTGWGLKESKEEVEKYWRSKPVEKEGATLGDILGNAY